MRNFICPETEEPCSNPDCKLTHCELSPLKGFEEYGVSYEDITRLFKQYKLERKRR